LIVGTHTINYIDSHSNGWHCGWWEIRSENGGRVIVGGPIDGRVGGAGGPVHVDLTAEGAGHVGNVQGVDVVIHTSFGARRMMWEIDGISQQFSGYDDHQNYVHHIDIAEGPHKIYTYDACPGCSTPKDVIFVLDDSGSMDTDGRLETCKQSMLEDIFANRLHSQDRVGLITLNQGFVPLLEYSPAHKARLEEFLTSLTATGQTPLWHRMHEAILMLKNASSAHHDQWIIALTDGQASDDSANNWEKPNIADDDDDDENCIVINDGEIAL
jgi:hypothetical protein